MIMTIVESGGKLPKGASAAVFAMLAYVAAASIVAAIGDLGAGLLVLAMGGVAVGIVDYVMWRDVTKDAAAPARLGGYVLRGPEAPSAIGHFDPIRTEGPAPAPVRAAVAAPAPAEPAPVEPAPPQAANDETAPVADAATADAASAETAAAVVAAVRDAAPEEKADAVGSRPPALAAPEGVADDLKRINGIGPANEAKLNALGIYHFDQIAAWDDSQARWVGTYLAFPGRIEREDWVGQARGFVAAKAATA